MDPTDRSARQPANTSDGIWESLGLNQSPKSPRANGFSVLKHNPQIPLEVCQNLAEEAVNKLDIYRSAHRISEGRSIYVDRPSWVPAPAPELDMIKLKGAKLCSHTRDRLLQVETVVVSPVDHWQVYGKNNFHPGHLAINDRLDASVVPARVKYNGSLELDGANREYSHQAIAASQNRSFPAVFVIQLFHDSVPIKNRSGEEVAIACLFHSSQYSELSDFFPLAYPLDFARVHRKDLPGLVDDIHACQFGSALALPPSVTGTDTLALEIERAMLALGRGKRSLFEDCLIGQHNSHRANVFQHRESGDQKFADFDSSSLMTHARPRLRGAQALRDIFSECLRIEAITLLNFNVHQPDQILFGLQHSLSPFLKGVFPSSAARFDGTQLIGRMLDKLNAEGRQTLLDAKLDICRGYSNGVMIPALTTFTGIGKPLLEAIFCAIQEDPQFRTAGFELIGLNYEQRAARFESIIQQYKKAHELPLAIRRRHGLT